MIKIKYNDAPLSHTKEDIQTKEYNPLLLNFMYKCIDSYLSNSHESMENKKKQTDEGMITEALLIEDKKSLGHLCALINASDDTKHEKLDQYLLQCCDTTVQEATVQGIESPNKVVL